MENNDSRYIRLPVWLAAIIISVILAVAGDTWRTVYAVRRDLDILKTALAVKGVIDLQIVEAGQDAAKLTCFRGIQDNSANTPN
jgi:hypothetical protein